MMFSFSSRSLFSLVSPKYSGTCHVVAIVTVVGSAASANDIAGEQKSSIVSAIRYANAFFMVNASLYYGGTDSKAAFTSSFTMN